MPQENDCAVIESTFPGLYFTVIALIQGIALSQLVGVLEYSNQTDLFWPRLLATGFVVFTVWHHYMYGASFMRWFPGFGDSLFPLGLGFAEFQMVRFCKGDAISSWLLWSAVLFLFAAFAYLNAFYKIDPSLYMNRMSKESSETFCLFIRRTARRAAILCLLVSGTCAAGTLWQSHWCFVIMWVLFPLHLCWYERDYYRHIRPAFLTGLRGKEI